MSEQPKAPGSTAAPSTAVVPVAALATKEPNTPILTQGHEPQKAEPPKYQRVIGRLTKIEIENYRAFRGRFELDLPGGSNLLVYGENGAGKSSLFHALQDFLEAPERRLKLENNRHHYSIEPAAVRLTFSSPSAGDGHPAVGRPFEWSPTKNDPSLPEMRTVDKGKGFLDYKALLRVHLLSANEQEVNLFDICIDPLLAQFKNPASSPSLTFLEEWLRIKDAFRPRIWQPAGLDDRIKEFNAGFERAVKDTFAYASELLREFDSELAVEIEFTPATYLWRPQKRLTPPKILARPSFRRLQRKDYSRFLNEARLSALAIAIYFSGLKLSPSPDFRLLVLDDILIGLDMSNRVKVLDILQKHFADWQVIILTYSKAWFERLKDHLDHPSRAESWLSVILWEEWRDGENSPRVVAEGSGNLLSTARSHLAHKDYTAAAVYARKAFEGLCHHVCAKAALFVLHVGSSKDRKVEHYWSALNARLGELLDDGRRATALELIARLEQAREFVLNRNAHFEVEDEDTLSGEVGAAIGIVDELTQFFRAQSWANECFQSGRVVPPLEQMNAHLTAARKAAAQKANKQCRLALSRAHGFFWIVFGEKIGVLLPLGSAMTPASIWPQAVSQGKLTPEILARLTAARPYLYGSIKSGQFDAAKFEEASKLLEDLCVPAPAGT